MKTFRAPWGKALVWLSVLSVAICVGIGLWSCVQPVPQTVRLLVHPVIPSLLLATILGAALFTIRGYAITPDAILIQRLLWTTRLPRTGLVSVTADPKAMCKCLRTCGNGGVFSFTGWYWSKRLGHFHAYVTDLNRCVVLRWEKRTAVLSPDDPEAFVRELMG